VTDVTADPAPLLEVRNLSTSFQTSRGLVRAVDGVSLELRRGATLGIVGESGSGKSVFARSLMSLLPKSAVTGDSSVRFNGTDLRALSRRELRGLWGAEVAMVFQDPMTSLNPVVKIERQITEGLRFHFGLRGKAATDRAVQLLADVGIPAPRSRLDVYPHHLSGGMRQRVAIAIALACSPSLLLADEPTTALDVTVQRQILDLLQRLQAERGMAMILITHDLGVAAGRTDEIAVMYAGRIVERAPTTILFDHPRHPYTEALLASIPRLEYDVHTQLNAIPGRPPDLIGPRTGCAFAPRCAYAQPRCLEEDPVLAPATGENHEVACFFPVGTDRGDSALAANSGSSLVAASVPAERA
jgi:peptide/nickel transport system ATP-binding protein